MLAVGWRQLHASRRRCAARRLLHHLSPSSPRSPPTTEATRRVLGSGRRGDDDDERGSKHVDDEHDVGEQHQHLAEQGPTSISIGPLSLRRL
jgi:hypothetical protein